MAKKGGGPNNAGTSGDVYENKWRKKQHIGESEDVNENKVVMLNSGYIIETKEVSSKLGP